MNRRLGTGVDFKAQNRGHVKLFLDAMTLMQPSHWRKPRKIFVCSMTDLFASFVPDEWIDRIFAVMALCPQHQFLVLTKRPARMSAYLMGQRRARICDIAEEVSAAHSGHRSIGTGVWPLPNLWLGVSVEDQARADERIPWLLDTPAAVRFVSAEPLFRPVDLSKWLTEQSVYRGDITSGFIDYAEAIDWVIVGGESGPQARPLNIEWVRSIIAQCKAAGVACFVKQLGTVPIIDDALPFGLDWPEGTRFGNQKQGKLLNGRCALLRDRKGANWNEWPEDLRVRQYPKECTL